MAVFCLAQWRVYVRRGAGSAGADCSHDRGLLAHQPFGWRVHASISRMGLPCLSPHVVGVAKQPQGFVVSRLDTRPNPSVERTHNGGAQCSGPSGVVPQLCAAHVKR